MKKIILILLLVGLFLVGSDGVMAACNFDPSKDGATITGSLDECMKGTSVVKIESADLAQEGFRNKLGGWTNNIALILGALAVGAIVYGGLLMTLSTGEDEQIKKAKDVVKWGILGFLAVISASAIITIVVKVMYSL